MSKPNEAWIPVSDLANMESGELVWRVNLPPYVPAENIGVNALRLGRLARLGGFESLRIGSYEGETTSANPGIVSVGGDGTATASRSITIAKAETQVSSVNPLHVPYDHYDEYIWTKGQVLLNAPEIEARIAEKGLNLRDGKAWSSELNAALTKGVRGAVNKNLIGRPSKSNINSYFIFTAVTTGLNYLSNGSHDLVGSEAELVAAYQLFFRPVAAKLSYHLPFRERRLSLVPAIQLDRVIAAHGLSRALPLVKSLENKT